MAFALQTEGLIAASISKSDTTVGGSSALSNKKSIWSSSNWSNTGD